MRKTLIVLTGLLLVGGNLSVVRAGKPVNTPKHLILERVQQVNVGQPQRYEKLTMIPLVAKANRSYDYLTLDEAIKNGSIQISEKEAAEVNRIAVRSRSGRPVFIMDGEEVVGAKQNRILNSSIMIPPKASLDLPVSCVEHGRWSEDSRSFSTGKTQLFASARQMNNEAVTVNYAAQPTAAAQSDQEGIWSSVAQKRAKMSLRGSSGPMHEVYQKYDKDINNYAKHFELVKGQVGAIFAVNGRIIGADIFDQSGTMKKLFSKIVKSYALDAIDPSQSRYPRPAVKREEARRFLQQVSAVDVSIKDYKSIGEGDDVRISSKKIKGAGLIVANRVVHVVLFAPAQVPVKPVIRREISPNIERNYRNYRR